MSCLKKNKMGDELFRKKLAYPYEKYKSIEEYDKPLDLKDEDYFSTLKQSSPSKEQIERTREIVTKYNIETR